MPSSLPAKASGSKKRKAGRDGGGEVAVRSTSSHSQDFLAKLSAVKESLSSAQDLNPLSELHTLISTQANVITHSDTLIPALTLLTRTLIHLIRNRLVQAHVNVDQQTGLLKTSKDDSEVVHNWIREQYNSSILALVGVMCTHSREKSKIAALNALMEVQKVASAALPNHWAVSPWKCITNALFDSQQDTNALLNVLVVDYAEKYADVKMSTYRVIRQNQQSSSQSTSSSRSKALQVLLEMSSPPSTKSAIKGQEYLVDTLQVSSQAKKTKKKGKNKNKYSEDGDDQDEGEDSSEEGEEEDLNWFSDSDDDDEQQDDESTGHQQSRKQSSSSSARRRRKSAITLPLHSALSDTSAWKVNADSAWTSVILSSHETLTRGEINTVLKVMPKKILPLLTKPQLYADWLLDCLQETSESSAILSLAPLYQLHNQYSLTLPSLYTRLYAMITPNLLHSSNRSYSLRMIALFLSSDKLSLTIIAAFLKRLSRCALRAGPGGIIPVVIMTYNLLKRHKDGMHLLHTSQPEGWIDPFDEEATDPAQSNALQSSLVEFASLGALNTNSIPSLLKEVRGEEASLEAHYHAPTTTIIKILSQPFTKEQYEVEEFLDHSYSSLLRTEIGRTIEQEGKKRKTTHAPAVRFVQPGHKVRVFPKDAFSGTDMKEVVDVPAGEKQESRTGFAPAPMQDTQGPPEGLDAEELEAWEAMQQVQGENQKDKEVEEEEKKRSKTAADRGDVMALWTY
ncbi:unnamed protein product [Sympodiomycopsis kandeliae]